MAFPFSFGFGLHRLMQPWPSPRTGVCKRKAKPAKFSGLSERATESRKIFDLFCLQRAEGKSPLSRAASAAHSDDA